MVSVHRRIFKALIKPLLVLVPLLMVWTSAAADFDDRKGSYRECVREARALGSEDKMNECRLAKKKFQLCVRDFKAAGRKQKMEICRRRALKNATR